jgi:hypothetical protein
MKRLLLAVLILFALTIRAVSQNPNPQPSFSSAVLSANPSLYLNFNDFSTNFLDQISGLTFAPSYVGSSTAGGIGTVTTVYNQKGIYMVSPDFEAGGAVSTVSIKFNTAPTAGAQYPILVATDNGGGSYTITAEPGYIAVAATTALQTFTPGAGGLSAFNVVAGQTIGVLVPTANLAIGTGSAGAGTLYYLNTQTIPAIGTPTAYTSNNYLLAFSATVSSATYTSAGTATPRQTGFDFTTPDNTSAEFTYNAWNSAPNTTLGAIDWSTPWTMMVHVDRLNWNRTGTLVLASKGDSSSTLNNWWKLYIQMVGLYSEVCFARNGYGSAPYVMGGTNVAAASICTNAGFDAVPNGFNYNIMVTDNGAGNGGAAGHLQPPALALYINGLNSTYLPETATGGAIGFGYAILTLGGSGTGYANSTAYTSTGGGPNCLVTGVMTSVSGVPSTLSPGPTADWGCTSAPTISFTAPTGIGATITATTSGTSMNSTTLPLMVPGYVSAGVYYGIAGATSSQTPTYVDEAVIFPSNLSLTQISNIFYQSKFHQEAVKTLPTPVPVLVFDDDGGGDMDNFFALQMAIAIQQRGIMHLAGVVSEDESVTCEAMWRQMLDQAGLNNIPLSVPSTFANNSGTGFCTTTNVAAYNASTPLSNAAWEPSTTMYRTIFAKYPTTPIDIVLGGPFTAMAEFMVSPADSISPLTGLQLMAQNAANGGAIYAQGLSCTPSAYPATTPCSATIAGDNSLADPVSGQYVVANNGTTPIYWIGGTPQIAGPGVLSTRTSNDPMYLLASHEGSDIRQCYDCLAVEAAVSSYFTGGIEVGYSGGTGYAASTPFTFSGGGTNCQGTGIMTASSGVPNGIQFRWGASATSSYEGIGNGCTSAPTVNLVGATGTGVTLTTYPTSVCGTYTISKTGSVWSGAVTSATCNNHYFQPFSMYANSTYTSGAPMSWFINSLVDPVPGGVPRVH